MEQGNETRMEMAAALRRLRWILTSLQMGGIGDWPAQLPPAGPPDIVVKEEKTDHPGFEEVLHGIRKELGECRRCRLHSGRTQIVFGDGSNRSGLLFVGEGPGFEEDQQGLPFVGRAGKLLNGMIKALGAARGDVYICNVVKCRPPDNRTPNPDEIEACSQFLTQQIDALRPRVICALGACAAQTLLSVTTPISRLRGKVHSWRGIPLVCTYHPAYLLRNPAHKAQAWQDLLLVYQMLLTDRKAI